MEALGSAYPTPRMLLALVEGLPAGCVTHAVLSGCPELVGWSREASLLADVWDAVQVNTFASVGSRKRVPRYPRPQPPRRADEVTVLPRGVAGVPGSLDGLRAMFTQALGG